LLLVILKTVSAELQTKMNNSKRYGYRFCNPLPLILSKHYHQGLQSELTRLRMKNDQLLIENTDLKSSLRKEIVTTDFRSGELAVGRVQNAALEKERDQVYIYVYVCI
jgi:hypothetical protein